jgi:5'-nucleotidase/UDP-sugar diphosphatase
MCVKRYIMPLASALFALSCLVPLDAAVRPPLSARLTILHTNDTHGHLLPFSYPSVVAAGSDLEGLRIRGNIGGVARRATLVAGIREELKRRGIPVWLIDAGDFADGTPFSTEYHGEADIAAMNGAGYNFATLGNHEFNDRLGQLKKLIGLAGYPILCANVVETSTGKLLTRAYTIESVGPLRVGVFGLTTREAATYPASREGLTFLDETDTARRMVATLRPKADIVVLISHAGEQTDLRLAAEVPGIDVIVGGHSHTRIPSGDFVWRSDDLKEDEVNGTIIVQAHQWGGELGRLDLLFERDTKGLWHIDRYRARLIPVSPDIADDPKVAAVVDKYWQPIAARYGEVLGQAEGDFSARGDDRAEYNLVADAVRETYVTEVEFENNGGVRAPIIAGPITRGDAIAVDPFENTVVTFSITGRDIRRILRQHAPGVSGLRYRLVNGELREVTVGGKPLEDDRLYTGASNSYFAGYALKGIEVKDTGRVRLDVLIEYIRRKGTVQPSYDGRRVVLGRPAGVAGAPRERQHAPDLSSLGVETNGQRGARLAAPSKPGGVTGFSSSPDAI